MLQERIRGFLLPAIVIGVTACANPADNKPEATVSDATGGAATPAPTVDGRTFVFAEESAIEFTGSKLTGSHDGGFHAFDGSIELVDGSAESSTVEVEIDATSLWADNERLTGHLKSADFFDVESHPTAAFRSTSIAMTPTGYDVTGDLTLRGVTKSITFPASITIGEGKVTAHAEFVIKRFDFGIEYPGKADDLIRDEVVIRLHLVAEPDAGEALS